MKALITADLHLTDNPDHEYRWDIFPFLKEKAAKHKCDRILILGDLSEAKDHHSAAFVNRLVRALWDLSVTYKIHILCGNHDYRDEEEPFFGFLTKLPNVQFINQITALPTGIGANVVCLPHRHHWTDDMVKSAQSLMKDAHLIVCHQTFIGSKAEGGATLSGLDPATLFAKAPPLADVVSGDVHTPQDVGRVVYIGSPHPVDHGDDFKCRVGVWDRKNRLGFIPRPTNRRSVLSGSAKSIERQIVDEGYGKGDSIQMVVTLPARDAYRWEEVRHHLIDVAKDLDVTVASFEIVVDQVVDGMEPAVANETPLELLARYSEEKGIDARLAKTGRILLKRVLQEQE